MNRIGHYDMTTKCSVHAVAFLMVLVSTAEIVHKAIIQPSGFSSFDCGFVKSFIDIKLFACSSVGLLCFLFCFFFFFLPFLSWSANVFFIISFHSESAHLIFVIPQWSFLWFHRHYIIPLWVRLWFLRLGDGVGEDPLRATKIWQPVEFHAEQMAPSFRLSNEGTTSQDNLNSLFLPHCTSLFIFQIEIPGSFQRATPRGIR